MIELLKLGLGAVDRCTVGFIVNGRALNSPAYEPMLLEGYRFVVELKNGELTVSQEKQPDVR